MSKLITLTGNGEWVSRMEEIAASSDMEMFWAENESMLFEQLKAMVGYCVVLLPNLNFSDIYSLCSKISQSFMTTPILFVFESEDEFNMKRALRAGVDDVIFLDEPLEKIQETLRHAMEKRVSLERKQPELRKNAKVITVASTKGGVGKTTVTVNLAAELSRQSKRVAILDLDLQFGDVSMYLDARPKRTIYDWVKEDLDAKRIEDYLTLSKQSIFILAAPQRPEFAEVITGNDVRKAIHALKQRFDVVLIDVSGHMNENTIVALESSDEILVMTYMDLPTLKNSKLLIETLALLGLEDRVKVVLNRHFKVKGISMDMVEQVVGKRLFATLPAKEKLMTTAANEGVPVQMSHPRSGFARNITKMAVVIVRPNLSNNKPAEVLGHAGGHA
ncbi:AAA family ATPase [Sporosarcina luteola]|uniref:AAA family ATPase n=1 Tax=Sporosarcina luteola TaxID=582850 RepID=UPI00203B6856|nr:AAA family ATPase [Sporosarcina luteola]MCM3709077.1 AAA family ATPase [Sporosarcina luteola]